MAIIYSPKKGNVEVKHYGTGIYIAKKKGGKAVIVSSLSELSEDGVLKFMDRSKIRVGKPKTNEYAFEHNSKQYIDKIASEMRKTARGRGLELISNKAEVIRKAKSGVLAELESLWQEYLKGVSEEYKKLHDDFLEPYKRYKIDKEIVANAERYAKEQFEHSIDESRRQEFFAYVMSGQLLDFNPKDFIPHWMKGDIVLKDTSAEDRHIQLKQTGGVFKAGMDTEGYKTRVARDVNNTLTGKMNVMSYAQAHALKAAGKMVEGLYKSQLKNGGGQYSPEVYYEVMKSYAESTKAEFVVFNFTGLQPSPNYSFTLRREQLADFARANPDLFYLRIGNIKVELGVPSHLELVVKDPKTIAELAKLRFSVPGGAFVHSYDELLYYKKIGSRKSANKAKAADATRYINETIRPRWNEFILIHESLFGEVKYKIDNRKEGDDGR